MSKTIKFIITSYLLLTTYYFTQAQVGINEDNSQPDASALLDIKSNDKGILIPRMTTAQRTAINNPAEGLMVYDTDTKSFWYYSTTSWKEMNTSTLNELSDADGDTKVLVEKNTDEDKIRFDINNREVLLSEENIINSPIITNANVGNSPNTTISVPSIWQSFTATSTGILDSIEIYYDNSVGSPLGTTLTITLLKGESTNGNILTTKTITRPSTNGLKGINFTGNIQLEKDSMYTFYFDGVHALKGTYGTYNDGQLNHGFGFNANFDIILKVYTFTQSISSKTTINGTLNINNAFSFPTTDGTAGQILTTDGNGTLSWNNQATPNHLSDTDGDTKIHVEENSDEDIIRMDINGSERLVLKKSPTGVTQLSLPNNYTNTFIGVDAGVATTPTASNINSLGKENSFLGYQAGQSNTNGNKNTFIGHRSGFDNTQGLENTFIGNYSGQSNTSGHYNTFIGSDVGYYNTIGGHNTFIGTGAGSLNLTGHSNVFIGMSSGGKNTAGSRNVFIGYYAGYHETNSHRLYIDNSGSATPLIYGEFDNSLLRVNGTLNINNAYSFPTTDGSNGQVFSTDGSGNVTWVTLTDDDNQDLSLSGNTLSLTNDNTSINLSGFLDSKWTTDGNDIYNSNTGNIGIGTTTPTKAKLEIQGSTNYQIPNQQIGYLNHLGNGTAQNPSFINYSIYASNHIAAAAFNAHSDERIKNIKGISNTKNDLATLMQIQVTDYQLRDTIDKGNKSIKKVIAQQVAEVYPQAVTNNLTEVVPDIYQRAELQNGWIMLATNLKVGDRVKIITETTNDIHEVTAVQKNRFKINSKFDIQNSKLIFVYGREVNDFHTVDYEAISMLNVSATQQLVKENKGLKERVAALEKEVQKINQLEVLLEQLQEQIISNQTITAE